MIKINKFAAIGLAAVTSVSAISISAFALSDNSDGLVSDGVEIIDVRDLGEGEEVNAGNGTMAGGGKIKSTVEPTIEPTIKPAADSEENIPTAEPTSAPETTEMIRVVLTNTVPEIYFHNEKIVFDSDPFIDENNRTQVPVRAVAETLGFDVEYNQKDRSITIKNQYRTVGLKIGSSILTVDDEEYKMDTEAIIVNDRTYIPLRHVMEAFDCGVIWK